MPPPPGALLCARFSLPPEAHVGPIFTPIPGVDLGVEGIWGQRETLAKEHGDLLRVNFMARYYVS